MPAPKRLKYSATIGFDPRSSYNRRLGVWGRHFVVVEVTARGMAEALRKSIAAARKKRKAGAVVLANIRVVVDGD